MEQERGITRRTALAAGAWSAPVIALALATPLAAASTGGGVLFVTGNAFGGAGIFLTGSNYNGAGAGQTYEVGEIALTFVLPEGVEFTVYAPGGWVVSITDNVVTVSNGVPLPPGETGDLGIFEILGDFPQGSTYTITSAPPELDVQYVGNIGGGVFV